MTTAEARTGMKRRLDIDESITTFDSMIDQFVLDAVTRISPTVYEELDEEEATVTISGLGLATIDLSALTVPVDDVRLVEFWDSGTKVPTSDYRVHRTTLTISGLPSYVTKVYISGLKTISLSTLPNYLTLPMYYYALSEFYSFLLANKSKYNVYMQNGRAAVDDMQDLIDFFEEKGNNYLENKATPYAR